MRLFNCAYCGKETSETGGNRVACCSRACAGQLKMKQCFEKNTKLFNEGKLKKRSIIYLQLVARDGNQCSCCKITDWNGKKIRFWVDHIDGDATNNAPSNFRLVCPNCDSQTDTFMAKNMGNGRKSRGLPSYG